MTIIDIFVMPFRNGEGSSFKREVFEEIMGRGAIDPCLPFENIEYADGSCEVCGAGEDVIASVIFDHFGGKTFFERLWELADRTGSFMSWEGRFGCAITDPAVISHLPAGMADDLKPVIAKNGRELEAAIFGVADEDFENRDE